MNGWTAKGEFDVDGLARRFFLIVLVLALGACSLRGAMNAMTSPEDRALAQATVESLRTNNRDWLEQHFTPELWAESGKSVGEAAALFPSPPESTELVSYSVNSSNIGSPSNERSQAFTLVTSGGGRWAVTRFRTRSHGVGAARVIAWSVEPRTTEPPELTVLKTMDRAVPWIWGGLLVFALLVAGIVVLIVRSNRRRRAAMSRPPDIRI
jgi:hypothetical protein